MARDKLATRKHIMDAAYVLFRRRGYARVNVDEIAEAAGVAKRTLYSHFDSKDALLEAVLEAQHEMTAAAFQSFGRKLVGAPEDVVRMFFSELKRWSAEPNWSGAGFTRLAMELADLPGHPARRIARAHKTLMRELLAETLKGAGLENADAAARKIWILCEGAMALMLIHGDGGYCDAAEEAALAAIRG